MNRLLFIGMTFLLALGYVGIRPAAAQETVFFVENFDGVTPPELPPGWQDATDEWESSSSVASTGSGINNLKVTGTGQAALQSASIDLSGLTSGTLEYLVRRTSSYEQDSMIVRASVDGGASFTEILLDKGAALPAEDSQYELVTVDLPASLAGVSGVVFQFDALGGSTSGSNVRIDDVSVKGSGEPATTTSTFGFSVATSSVDVSTNTFEVPVFIDFANTESLQGLQFELSWSEGSFDLTDVIRGSAIASTEWRLNFGSREGEARVVLLGDQVSTLGSGLYDPLMTLQFTVDAGNTALESELILDRVVGALSVRTGDDANLQLGLSSHIVSFAAGAPVFSADVASVDLGTTNIGEAASSVITVTNAGDVDLVISDVSSSNSLFSADLNMATITPGASQVFTVTFIPAFELFGYQEGILTFAHNAVEGSNDIDLSGTGTGGRGDMSNDGLVDAVDLVVGIDLVLETVLPVENQLQSADVFPFSAPDAVLDVRDLTVLSQAILLDAWPDESPLPIASPDGSSGKHGETGLVHLEMVSGGDHTVLYLNTEVPIRAFQIATNPLMGLQTALPSENLPAAGVDTRVYLDQQKSLKVLGAKFDGSSLPPGRYPLLELADFADLGSIGVRNALAVSATGERLAVGLTLLNGTSSEKELLKKGLALNQPYPNPFERHNTDGLYIPVTMPQSGHVTAEVYDLLGRRVAPLINHTLESGNHNLHWDGRDEEGQVIAAGLYLIRVSTAESSATRVFVVK